MTANLTVDNSLQSDGTQRAAKDPAATWRRALARLRPLVYLELGVIAVALALRAPWGNTWDGFDFGIYMTAAQRFPDPFYCQAGGCYVYSPAFAILMAPFTLLPPWLGLALWRVGGIVALGLAVRGGGPLALLVFCIPGLWESDQVAGNVMSYATAGMIAVIRWPGVRTVALYALLVALIPKPQFLPVLVYGAWKVPAARRYVLTAGMAGLAMLAWPGYLEALIHQPSVARADTLLPVPLLIAAAAGLTLAGLRWPRLLGAAAFVSAPYALPYTMVPLGLVGVKGRGADGRAMILSR